MRTSSLRSRSALRASRLPLFSLCVALFGCAPDPSPSGEEPVVAPPGKKDASTDVKATSPGDKLKQDAAPPLGGDDAPAPSDPDPRDAAAISDASTGGADLAAPRADGAASGDAAATTQRDAAAPSDGTAPRLDAAPARADTSAPPMNGDRAPASYIDLTHWKLQLPGPLDIKNPVLTDGYTSKYFFADPSARTVIFALDASESGSTSGSSYVRAELREQIEPGKDNVNWPVAGTHVMSARLRVRQSNISKVTVLQIHGYPNGTPPLLRIQTQNSGLIAVLKTDKEGNGENRPTLASDIGKDFFDVEIKVQNGKITVSYNGQPKLTQDLGFWPYENYFKAGAYPQANEGTVQLEYEKLTVTHTK